MRSRGAGPLYVAVLLVLSVCGPAIWQSPLASRPLAAGPAARGCPGWGRLDLRRRPGLPGIGRE
eukprot:6973350-Alexandrium_andersonii.AAC.1